MSLRPENADKTRRDAQYQASTSGLEQAITTNDKLVKIDANTDTLEALIGTTNTLLTNVNSKLTTLTNDINRLIGATNSKLDDLIKK